jgi:hypothetical protein
MTLNRVRSSINRLSRWVRPITEGKTVITRGTPQTLDGSLTLPPLPAVTTLPCTDVETGSKV